MTDEPITAYLVYTYFDEKKGPVARCWEPSDIHVKLLHDVSMQAINISGYSDNPPASLSVIPFSQHGMKAFIRSITYDDSTRRGGHGDSALIMLFREEEDSIFYKYFDHFDQLFAKFADIIIKKESKHEFTVTVIQSHLATFLKEIADLLNDVKEEEMASDAKEEFPDDGSLAAKHKFKIVVVGDPGVGKTSTVLRFTNKAFRKTYIPTIGVNVTTKFVMYGEIFVEFVIWDIAGHAKYSTVRKHFYSGANGQIFIFDLTDKNTLVSIKNWYNDVRKHEPARFFGVLLGNKQDLSGSRRVTEEEARAVAGELNLLYIETSAKSGLNVDLAFKKMAEHFMNAT